MRAVAEIQVIPIGVGVSVRAQVERARAILADSGLELQEHACGTNVEGPLDEILAVVQRLHEVLHAEGAPRISTALKIGTRTDRPPTLKDRDTGSAPGASPSVAQ